MISPIKVQRAWSTSKIAAMRRIYSIGVVVIPLGKIFTANKLKSNKENAIA